MATYQSAYASKSIDAQGNVAYTAEENAVWHDLIVRQHKIIQNRACDEYIHGLEILDLSLDHVPAYLDISNKLHTTTGWGLEPVPALISDDVFVRLLAKQHFPVTTFIRKREELNYLQEPDVFHEMYGHCPLLTNPAYAEFMHRYGELSLKATPEEQEKLSRLYWYTVEFGLINTPKGLRAYGSGILSSINETVYCLESPKPKRVPLDPLVALRTPFRIDIMQPIYFVLKDFAMLYKLADMDLLGLAQKACQLGDII